MARAQPNAWSACPICRRARKANVETSSSAPWRLKKKKNSDAKFALHCKGYGKCVQVGNTNVETLVQFLGTSNVAPRGIRDMPCQLSRHRRCLMYCRPLS